MLPWTRQIVQARAYEAFLLAILPREPMRHTVRHSVNDVGAMEVGQVLCRPMRELVTQINVRPTTLTNSAGNLQSAFQSDVRS